MTINQVHAVSEYGSASPMLVLVLTSILLILGTVALKVTTSDIQASANAKQAVEALYVAEAGMEHARSRITVLDIDSVLAQVDSSRFSEGGFVTLSDTNMRIFTDTFQFGSAGRYRVLVYDNNDGDGDIRVDSDGKIFIRSFGIMNNGSTKAIEALFAKTTTPTISQRGAIVAAGNVRTLGNLQVDGRDHRLDGSVIGGAGTKGIVTKGTFTRGGSSDIGGVDDFGFVYSPTNAAAVVAKVTQQGAPITVPAGPDEAIGLSGGTLKSLAQSGAGGSQYVTNPSSLTMPLRGVTYVELPCGGTWQSMNFGASEGILVVHSPCKDATIKNLNGGSFKGILIADDIVHVQNDIVGMVIQLSPAPSSGNCIGLGNGSIKYSSTAISQALSSIRSEARLVAWREL